MDVKQLIAKCTAFWHGLPGRRRHLLVVGLVVVLVAGGFFVQWLLNPRLAPLFTDLPEQDAAAVVTRLRELGVPYRLGGEGTTVLVPRNRVYELRLDMAAAGALQSGEGFELFDRQRLGMTDFERNLGYQRALQEELRRTIVSLEEVEDARVHLVIPTPSVFLQEQNPPSAGVMLQLRPMAKLQPPQVQGIMELVAASVAGLEKEQIRIIDIYGNVLSAGLDDGDTLVGGLQQRQLELKRRYELDLENRLGTMLTRILGPGQAVAMVTVDMDFTEQEITAMDYGEGSVVSEHVQREEGTSGAGATGPAGTTPNTEPPIYQVYQPASGTYNRSEEIHNYQVDYTQTSTRMLPGRVTRLSTAVAVNGPVNPELAAQVQEVVSAAVGYQPERGDQITVHSMAFETGWLDGWEDQPQPSPWYMFWQDEPLWAAVGAGVLLLLLLLAIRRRRQAAAPLAVPIEPLALSDDLGGSEFPGERSKREQVREIIRQRPQDASVLVKAWIMEN
ncbi:MAG TPA: flagellar M-ring protein FliF [Firmicutes bacterium]|nr:flagellar M-ring protein FliF [Bacillota bacterium]